MKLSTNVTSPDDGELGMVELCSLYLNDKSRRFWTKGEIIKYLNLAQLDIASEINTMYETYFVKSATTPSVAGQARYSLPADLVKLMGIEIADSVTDDNPQGLQEIHFTERNFYRELKAVNDKRDHGFFMIVGTDFDMLPPIQGDDKVLRIYYIQRLADLSDDDDESIVPSEHHELLVLAALRRARIKPGRRLPSVNELYSEQMDRLRRSIDKFSPEREFRREPFYGSYGPIPPVDGRMI